MKNSKALTAAVIIALIFAISAMAGPTANAVGPTTVSLGGADSYAVFAAATITSSGSTTINGDLGLHPGTSVTETPTMTVNGARNVTNAAALSARNLLKAAYIDAAGRTPFTTVAGGILGGMIFVAGVYRGGALDLSTTAPNNVVTLDGQNDPSAVFIFQAASTLITGASTTVNLINRAQSCNVFWQVGSSATLGASSTFRGTILAHTSISVGTSAKVDGRLLAGVGASTDEESSDTGALTLLTNNITKPTCEAAPAPAGGGGSSERERPEATPTPTPIATPIPAPVFPPGQTPAPTAAPAAPTAAPAAPTVAPTAAPAAPTVAPTVARAVAGTQTLPSTSTDPLGPLTVLGIGLTGIGILLLRRRPIRHL